MRIESQNHNTRRGEARDSRHLVFHQLARAAHEEGGARHAVALRKAVDRRELVLGQCDVDADDLRMPRRHLDENSDGVAVLAILHDLLEGARLRDGLTVLDHAVDMEGERLRRQRAGLIEGAAGGDATRKIGKGDTEVALRLLVDESDIGGHDLLLHLSRRPDWRSMLRSVGSGMSFFGCGTVTRPGFVGCLNCLWLPFCATSYHPSA